MAHVVEVLEAEHPIDPLSCRKAGGRYDDKRGLCLIEMEVLSDGTKRFVETNGTKKNNG